MSAKSLSPIVCDVFFLTELRPNEHVNVMAKFVVKGVSKGDIAYKRNQQCPSREATKDLIDVQFDPRRLALPLRMITAKYPGLGDSPSA